MTLMIKYMVSGNQLCVLNGLTSATNLHYQRAVFSRYNMTPVLVK